MQILLTLCRRQRAGNARLGNLDEVFHAPGVGAHVPNPALPAPAPFERPFNRPMLGYEPGMPLRQ